MSQHTVAASCACSTSTAGSGCVGWVGATSCLFMIDLTGRGVPGANAQLPARHLRMNPDARHDLNSLKLHLLVDAAFVATVPLPGQPPDPVAGSSLSQEREFARGLAIHLCGRGEWASH
jgi:hypothetical protein